MTSDKEENYKEKQKQSGAELSQAQVKSGYIVISLSLRVKLFLLQELQKIEILFNFTMLRLSSIKNVRFSSNKNEEKN